MNIDTKHVKAGYVLKRYPRFSKTSVMKETLPHQAADFEIETSALREVIETHFQDFLGRVRAPVARVPDGFRNAEALWSLTDEARTRLPGAWDVLKRTQTVDGHNLAQAIVIALACHDRGIGHLHAHFGTVSTSVARLAAALAGIRYSFTAYSNAIYFDYAKPRYLDVKIREASGLVTDSDYNVAYLRNNFDAPANRPLIYNGLDLDGFAHRDPDLGALASWPSGGWSRKRGSKILTEARRILRDGGRDVTCRIVGHGEEHDNLAQQIAASGLVDVVRLTGPMSQADVKREMQSAMALGLPCVATPVTGILELVRDGETGLLVSEGDAEALAGALDRLLGDADLRADLQQSGRAAKERDFDVERNAAALREVFAAAIEMSETDLRGVA